MEEACLGWLMWADCDNDNRVVFALDDGAESSAHKLLEKGLRQIERVYKDMILPATRVSFLFLRPFSYLAFDLVVFTAWDVFSTGAGPHDP